MNTRIERIPVYVRFRDGNAICVCHCGNKLCDRKCLKCTVKRDRYEGWQECMKQNRYGALRRRIFSDEGE